MLRTLLILSLTAVLAAGACAADGGLSKSDLARLKNSLTLDEATKAAINAVSNNDIRDLAINRDVTAKTDDIFSLELPTKGATDQEKTGRCWVFAGLNLVRQDVIKKYELEDFEFSLSYMAFWDKLEKANVFLDFMIKNHDRDILDRELIHMMEYPASDGGYWGYVVNLVDKYGVVPKKVMGETISSASTDRMDYLLNTMLRRDAMKIRQYAPLLGPDGLQEEKMKMLEDVYRLLVINYGVPPEEFEWRTVDEDGVAGEPVVYTPVEFYRKVIAADLSDYYSLGDYPIHETNKNYSINLTRSMADKPDITFINVDTDQMKALVLAALQDSHRVWFGCDMSHNIHSKKGLMAGELYDFEDLFGVDLGMSKTERLHSRHSASNHAMVFVGVDLVDGKPRKWKVENSWGAERGDGGFFTMDDEWFDEYVLNVIIHKKYMPNDLLKVSREKPIPLPVWDPAWSGIR